LIFDLLPSGKCRFCGQIYETWSAHYYLRRTRGHIYFRCKVKKLKENADYRTKHPEKRKSADQVYSSKHREKKRKIAKTWKSEHPEKVKAHKKQYRIRHPEKAKEQRKRYLVKHPSIIKVIDGRYRARTHGYDPDLNNNYWEYALEYFEYCCAVCHISVREKRLALCFWVPLIEGEKGADPQNVIPLCWGKDSCGQSKGAQHPHDWLEKEYGSDVDSIEKRIADYFERVRINDRS